MTPPDTSKPPAASGIDALRLALAKTEPASEGAAILDAVEAFLGRFIAYPSRETHIAHTLWIAHTHAMEAWETTPRIAFLSPEPECGKSRALELSALLVPGAVQTHGTSTAYLVHKVGQQEAEGICTLLHDEIDTVFGPRAKDHEDMRAVLNAGHRRGAVAGRCVVKGPNIFTQELPAFCAVALAGIGNLPDTILSRSIIVRMRRRAKGERVESFRVGEQKAPGAALAERLAAWAADRIEAFSEARPRMPEGIADRNADVWEPLFAIADEAGGAWPSVARVTAVTLVTHSRENAPSLGIRLLTDLRHVFGEEARRSTDYLLRELIGLPESPWGDLKGKPLDARGLAARLRQYEIKPSPMRIEGEIVRGYLKADLADAWDRYLAASP